MQKSDWKKCKLGDVCELIGGFAFKSKSFGAFANKVIKIANIQPPYVDDKLEGVDLSNYNVEKLKKYLINYNDFCLAMTGATIGKLGRYKSKLSAYLNQRVLTFRPSTDVDKDFLYHYLSLDFFQRFINNHIDSETAQPNISATSIGQFELLLPPLEEQKRIAEILGSLDDKIELLQKQNKTLEDMAKALFKSWFVDFDVVRAKQKGLPKADIMCEYHLTDELYDLFPSSFADSPLGPIPSGWEVVKISDVARVVGGGTPSTKQTKFFSASGTAIAWLTPKDLSGYQYKYIDHGQTDITQEGLTHSSAQLMPTNSIVFSSRAPIGYIAISLGEIATNQGFKSLVPLERHWTEFLYQYLCYNRYIIEGLGTGSTFKEVSGSVMKNISLCFPSSEILKAFEQETEIINSKQKIIMKEIQTLTELRDTLLPRLISGKIRV